jgi:hypothetical protein
MKSTIGSRKLAEGKAQLALATKELAAQHATATAKDVHRIDRGDSFKPIKIIGGDEHKSSHGTIYQKKMLRGDTATNARPSQRLSIFAKQIAGNKVLGS